MSDERDARLEALLAETGFAGARRTPVSGDASTRAYERLTHAGRSAILMNAPPRAESAPCPPGASPEARAALGYNALARLAASRVEAFAALAAHLRALGLSAPEIYALDVDAGFCILEDMGDGLYWSLLGEGADPAPLYEAAIDALVQASAFPAPGALAYAGARWPLLSYDTTALHAEASLLTDWFAPKQLNRPLSDDALAEWRIAWDKVFALLDPADMRLVLRDCHSPNLMWLPDRRGAARAGVLETFSRVESAVASGEELSPTMRADMRVAATYATEAAREVAQWAHLAAGTTAIREGSRLERAFRDLYTGTQHAFISEKTYIDSAQIWLGLADDLPGV
jgi:aminoglycoside/choline kinase family phosphotransferase